MKTFNLKIEEDGTAWLLWNVDIPGEDNVYFNESEQLLKTYPKYLIGDDWVYFGKDGNLHLIDDEPIKKMQREIQNEDGTLKPYETIGMCAAIQNYMKNPKLLYGEEEQKYLKKKGRI